MPMSFCWGSMSLSVMGKFLLSLDGIKLQLGSRPDVTAEIRSLTGVEKLAIHIVDKTKASGI